METTNRSGPFYSLGRGAEPVATPRRAPFAPARPATRRNRNASENHDHVGRGPVRRNAPPSAPSRHRPTLLQHERLHKLSNPRPGQRRRSLRDLRLHAPASLTSAPPLHGLAIVRYRTPLEITCRRRSDDFGLRNRRMSGNASDFARCSISDEADASRRTESQPKQPRAGASSADDRLPHSHD